MKQDPRGPILAIALILVLAFGVYWGVVVAPKKDAYWSEIASVSVVSGAVVQFDGTTMTLNQNDAEHVFDLIRQSPDFSPNHPAATREGMVTFKTDRGDISLKVLDTDNQGTLLWAFSAGDAGWNFGVRRCDELGRLLKSDQGDHGHAGEASDGR